MGQQQRESREWQVKEQDVSYDRFIPLYAPAIVRPAFWYENDEICVVASERPVIQTAFNLKAEEIKELTPGNALIIKKSGFVSETEINAPRTKLACSFERIYFSRGSDKDIYKERKNLVRLVFPQLLESIDFDLKNSVFSFIPNTAEVSFYGMIKGLEDHLNQVKIEERKKLEAIRSDIQASIEQLNEQKSQLSSETTVIAQQKIAKIEEIDASYISQKESIEGNNNLSIGIP